MARPPFACNFSSFFSLRDSKATPLCCTHTHTTYAQRTHFTIEFSPHENEKMVPLSSRRCMDLVCKINGKLLKLCVNRYVPFSHIEMSTRTPLRMCIIVKSTSYYYIFEYLIRHSPKTGRTILAKVHCTVHTYTRTRPAD